ncbi:MAG: polyphosphate kinase 1 [Flavobacteriales bacterium]|nr:polyphosphate kinase 1 [Flavobacteriales bacterium]
MINEATLRSVHAYVRRWFTRNMPEHMVFHDLEHTLSVARAAIGIGVGMRLTTEELAELECAALFHDTGYAWAYERHEEHSADLAELFLTKKAVDKRTIAKIRSLIMATKYTATPRTVPQKVMRDADSAKAGQIDFAEKSEQLRMELEVIRKNKLTPAAWIKENLNYLEAHRFLTPFAKERYGEQKRLNLEVLRAESRKPAKSRKPTEVVNEKYFDRDLSWLSFNDRVLQEAKDPNTPLLERINFLAIYSNNLDEFYSVRVAGLRSLLKLKKTDRKVWEVPPDDLVERLNQKAILQQREFGALYRETLLPALAKNGIRILNEKEISTKQRKKVLAVFNKDIAPLLQTAAVREGNEPFIEDRKLYFACRLLKKGKQNERLVLLNIPSDRMDRFVRLPSNGKRTDLLFLDDAVRIGMSSLFKEHKVLGAYAIKLSRDAELYLDEEFDGNVKDKVRKSLRKRTTGVPARFLYDSSIPATTLSMLRSLLGLGKQDLVPGGRYHNFSDLMNLPVKGHGKLRNVPWPPMMHPAILSSRSTFLAIAKQDLLWHYPYHDLGMLVHWIQKAAADPAVKHIAITLYRVAKESVICAALIDALHNGKKVTAFVEVQARFDEKANLYWGEALENAGACVMYSYENVKVHCKLLLIERTENKHRRRYAYLSTGNFNERTSKIYADSALLTAKPALTEEVAQVFRHLEDRSYSPQLKHLLLAPYALRSKMEALIDKEIELAQHGKYAEIMLKLNSLEDHALIRKLYDASNAGVKIRLIIRGICCLVPGIKGLSTNIKVISIVDRYLEHTRVYVFNNDGKKLIYMSSADWMGRNLDRRIEVAFPILDPDLKREILDLLKLQWNDRTKARLINAKQTNPYVGSRSKKHTQWAQLDTWKYLMAERERQ